MSAEGQIELVGSEIESLDIVEIIRARLDKEFSWRVIEEYPESMDLGANIRERSEALVKELALSISNHDQMQECTGDVLSDGTYRVVAGQHRYWAVEYINEQIDEHNRKQPESSIGRRKLRVRVADREFTPYEMLDLQITENLHKDMRPEEEADAIDGLYLFYKEVFDEEEISVADFARRIVKGETKVRNAIKFMGVDEKVRELVERDALLYSVATKITRLPKDKQLQVAAKIIKYNFSGKRVDTFIKNTLGEGQIPSLFTEMREFEEANYRIAFRSTADRVAKDAAGYFKRLLVLLEVVDEIERVTMTDTIRDILSDFIFASDEFKTELEKEAPHLWKILKERVIELTTKLKRTVR
ncbi:ParB N-terminal domain-containing protein [Patescibacteria group bacterium]|nr:ParB N-terminal domain-containing protein [Patescibacteria group bacterium]